MWPDGELSAPAYKSAIDLTSPSPSASAPIEVYEYRYADGELAYQTLRYEPKTFRQRRWDGERWVWNLQGVTLVPYRLPELLSADKTRMVFICEGEKDADALTEIGLVATTSPLGAGKWRGEYSEHFDGRKVAILPDNDDAGRQHAKLIAESLYGVADARIVTLEGLPPKGDVSDWLDAGNTGRALLRLAEAAFESKDANPIRLYDAAHFLAIPYPPLRYLAEGLVVEESISVVYGPPGSMKSYLTTSLALSIATGRPWLGKIATRRARVLVIQEDTPAATYQRSYVAPMSVAMGINADDLRGQMWIAPENNLRIDNPASLGILNAMIEQTKPELLVLDSFYLLHGSDGSPKEMADIMRILRGVREESKCAIWIIDHTRKTPPGGRNGDGLDELSGASEKSKAMDAIFSIAKSKDMPGEITMKVQKSREGWTEDEFRIRLEGDKAMTLLNPYEAPEDTGLSRPALMVRNWLRDNFGPKTQEEISNGVNMSLASVGGVLQMLLKTEMITIVGKKGRARAYMLTSATGVNRMPEMVVEDNEVP